MFLANWIILTLVQSMIVVLALAGVVFIRARSTAAELTELKESAATSAETLSATETERDELRETIKNHETDLVEMKTRADDLQDRLEAAETARATAEEAQAAAEEAAAGAGGNPAHDASLDEMRSLLQQFTLESRDMLNCIDELQKENERLKAELALLAAASETAA